MTMPGPKATKFDRHEAFMLYLFEKMDENSRTSRDNKPRQRGLGLAARNRALFFCALALMLGVLGSLFLTACSTTTGQSERDTLSESPQVSSESDIERATPDSAVNPESIQPKSEAIDERAFYHDAGATIEKLQTENETLQTENESLKKENDRLRLEVIRLNEELLEANAEIYSLNRKLDAIFKPEPGGN